MINHTLWMVSTVGRAPMRMNSTLHLSDTVATLNASGQHHGFLVYQSLDRTQHSIAAAIGRPQGAPESAVRLLRLHQGFQAQARRRRTAAASNDISGMITGGM